MDQVRVLRIIEYVGARGAVEKQLASSIHGTKDWGSGVRITATTLGEFPEILYNTGDRIEIIPLPWYLKLRNLVMRLRIKLSIALASERNSPHDPS